MLSCTLSGDANAAQNSRQGVYVLSDEKFNEHPVWLTSDNKSIRFEKEFGNCWYVGEKGNHGSRKGGLAGPENNDLFPQEIKNGWRYQDYEWTDANPGDVVFKVVGKD